MSVLIVGSIAIDDVTTPEESKKDLLGGSASYAALGASFFSPVRLVGIVGEDFPSEHIDLFRNRGVCLEGLQQVPGKTFRWSGEYMEDMNIRETRSIALNVFEQFTPDLPDHYRETEYVLLGNIAPALQIHVLEQMKRPKFVIADTMDLWINTTKEDLKRLLGKIDMLILNDSEAKDLTGEKNLLKAARAIRAMGPRYIAIKKGEHGCLLFGDDEADFFTCGAFPLEEVKDPTGAGDTFAGGFAGHLASINEPDISFENLRQSVVFGSVMASFNVEDFSLERLREIEKEHVHERASHFRKISIF